MTKLKWWLRVVGLFYLLQFVANAIVLAPIRAVGPEGALAQASEGDPMARFLVDTWITFGLEIGAIGIVLLIASRTPNEARLLSLGYHRDRIGTGHCGRHIHDLARVRLNDISRLDRGPHVGNCYRSTCPPRCPAS